MNGAGFEFLAQALLALAAAGPAAAGLKDGADCGGFTAADAASARKATEELDRYRDNLSAAGDTAPWKGKLPKGAYSDIIGVGDDAVWTDINGALTVRKGNVTLQVTLPKEKLEQVKLAGAVVAKF